MFVGDLQFRTARGVAPLSKAARMYVNNAGAVGLEGYRYVNSRAAETIQPTAPKLKLTEPSNDVMPK